MYLRSSFMHKTQWPPPYKTGVFVSEIHPEREDSPEQSCWAEMQLDLFGGGAYVTEYRALKQKGQGSAEVSNTDHGYMPFARAVRKMQEIEDRLKSEAIGFKPDRGQDKSTANHFWEARPGRSLIDNLSRAWYGPYMQTDRFVLTKYDGYPMGMYHAWAAYNRRAGAFRIIENGGEENPSDWLDFEGAKKRLGQLEHCYTETADDPGHRMNIIGARRHYSLYKSMDVLERSAGAVLQNRELRLP